MKTETQIEVAVANAWAKQLAASKADIASLRAINAELLAALKDLYLLIDKHSGHPPIGKLVASTERARIVVAKANGTNP